MAYKIWGTKYEMFNKEGIIKFFNNLGINQASQLISEAEATRKSSVKIGDKKVMLFRY